MKIYFLVHTVLIFTALQSCSTWKTVLVSVATPILNAQETKTITGRIISEDLETIPKAMIHNMDTTVLGVTDMNDSPKLSCM